MAGATYSVPEKIYYEILTAHKYVTVKEESLNTCNFYSAL